MKKFFSKLIRFWNEERSLHSMMLLLLLFIFVLVPSVNPERSGDTIIKIIYSLLLLTGILSVAKGRKYINFVIILSIISLSVSWLSHFQSTVPVLIANDIAAILLNLFFAIAILIKTFQPGDITYYRIGGSIVVYLLLGLIFMFTYHAIYMLAGAASFNNITDGSIKELLYFSFVTLTTVGYGDITPVYPLARSLANFESLIGQLYPAILIARLVSMELESSSAKKRENK